MGLFKGVSARIEAVACEIICRGVVNALAVYEGNKTCLEKLLELAE